MSEDQHRDGPEREEEDSDERRSPANPFAEPDPEDESRGPALIDSQRSAAVLGVVVGLVALFFVVAICVAASFAFG